MKSSYKSIVGASKSTGKSLEIKAFLRPIAFCSKVFKNKREENLSLSSQYILLNLVFLNLPDFPLRRQIL